MASVNWQKIKSPSEMKRLISHSATETRLQSNHTNQEINKGLSKDNLDPLGYEDVCANFDERLAFLDAQPGANKRRDRVVGIGLVIPIPNEIPDDRLIDYAQGVHDRIVKMFGIDNVIGEFTHVDEVHDYYDSEKECMRTSMRHMHAYVIPVADNKLCCDKLFRKSNLYELNNTIDDFTRKEFGCQFMTGEKTKSKKSVEQLKNESCAAELENSLKREKLIYEQKTRLLQAREDDVNKREKSLAERELTLKRKIRLLQEKEDDVNKRVRELDELERKLDERERKLDERESVLKARENALNAKITHLDKDIQQFHTERERAREARKNELHALGWDNIGDRGDQDQPTRG